MVYKLAFNFNAVDQYFATYTDLLLISDTPGSVKPPRTRKNCPGIILASKGILRESLPVLYSTPMIFTHGILKASLRDVVSPRLIQRLTHITITDAGIDLLHMDLVITFHGVQHLFKQLADILQDGHNLRELKFIVKANDFNRHLRNCADQPDVKCGIKPFLLNLQTTIGRIRGIKKVVLEGDMSHEFKTLMIQGMTSQPENLFKLPLSVRKQIYIYAANPNDATCGALEKFMTRVASGLRPHYPLLTTPSVLLLNRQIYEECLNVIHKSRWLTISGNILAPKNPSSIFRFISPSILHHIRYLELDFQHWQYTYLLPNLCRLLRTAIPGQHSHSLHCFHLHFDDSLRNDTFYSSGFSYPDQHLAMLLQPLAKLRGIRQVTFSGGLPDCYTLPLGLTMMGPVGSSGLQLFGERIDGRGKVALKDLEGAREDWPIEVE